MKDQSEDWRKKAKNPIYSIQESAEPFGQAFVYKPFYFNSHIPGSVRAHCKKYFSKQASAASWGEARKCADNACHAIRQTQPWRRCWGDVARPNRRCEHFVCRKFNKYCRCLATFCTIRALRLNTPFHSVIRARAQQCACILCITAARRHYATFSFVSWLILAFSL